MTTPLDQIVFGNILTMDNDHPRVAALGIKAGRIVSYGNTDTVQITQGIHTEILDFGGKTIIPGLIDTHVHPCPVGTVKLNVDLTTATSVAEILSRIRSKAETLPFGQPVLAFNFNYDVIKEQRLPTREELDRAAPGRSIAVMVYDLHSAMLNSEMLQMLNLPATDPGVVTDANGHPTGLIEDPAIAGVVRRFHPRDPKEILAALKAGVAQAVQKGLTTLHVKETYGNIKVLLDHEDELSVRVVPLIVVKRQDAHQLPEILGDQRLKGRAAIAFMADGAPDSKTAAFFESYPEDVTNFGMLYYDTGELREQVALAHKAGFQISVHCCGTRAVEQVLNVYESVLAEHPRHDHRHRIEHFEMPQGNQINRAVAAGIHLPMQPMFLFLSGPDTYDSIRALLGSVRVNRWKPFRTILDAGGFVAGGSDAPVTPMDPLGGIAACINHPNPAQRITRYEALQLFTVNGARLGFLEDTTGTLVPGKAADLTVLDANPYEVPAEEIATIGVAATMVDGQVVYSRS